MHHQEYQEPQYQESQQYPSQDYQEPQYQESHYQEDHYQPQFQEHQHQYYEPQYERHYLESQYQEQRHSQPCPDSYAQPEPHSPYGTPFYDGPTYDELPDDASSSRSDAPQSQDQHFQTDYYQPTENPLHYQSKAPMLEPRKISSATHAARSFLQSQASTSPDLREPRVESQLPSPRKISSAMHRPFPPQQRPQQHPEPGTLQPHEPLNSLAHTLSARKNSAALRPFPAHQYHRQPPGQAYSQEPDDSAQDDASQRKVSNNIRSQYVPQPYQPPQAHLAPEERDTHQEAQPVSPRKVSSATNLARVNAMASTSSSGEYHAVHYQPALSQSESPTPTSPTPLRVPVPHLPVLPTARTYSTSLTPLTLNRTSASKSNSGPCHAQRLRHLASHVRSQCLVHSHLRLQQPDTPVRLGRGQRAVLVAVPFAQHRRGGQPLTPRTTRPRRTQPPTTPAPTPTPPRHYPRTARRARVAQESGPALSDLAMAQR